jgi:hypothetical protein
MRRFLVAVVDVARELVVGDDPFVAVGVVLFLAACALLAHLGVVAWWLPPLGVPLLLWISLLRATRRRLAPSGDDPATDVTSISRGGRR